MSALEGEVALRRSNGISQKRKAGEMEECDNNQAKQSVCQAGEFRAPLSTIVLRRSNSMPAKARQSHSSQSHSLQSHSLQPYTHDWSFISWAGNSCLSPPSIAESSIIFCPCLSTSVPVKPVGDANNKNDDCNCVDERSASLPLVHQSAFRTPLPRMLWTNPSEFWALLTKKDEMCFFRDPAMFEKQSMIEPQMRSILIDWIVEVCEVYHIHRETFHLTVDFIDRYLSVTSDIQKQQLQLIGVTALFVAAKLEEIYPPRVIDFAYVTDRSCSVQDILTHEIVLLGTLHWELSPITPNGWLNLFMQLISQKGGCSFFSPCYSQTAFIQVARLIDLCFLDIGSLRFSYRVLTASALYHSSSSSVALKVSGFDWPSIEDCVHWMKPFAVTLRENGDEKLCSFDAIPREDRHNIQTHSVGLPLHELAKSRAAATLPDSRSSPEVTHSSELGVITPPASVESVPLG